MPQQAIRHEYKRMRKWTKEVLAELDLKKLSSRFLFCSLTPSWEQDENVFSLLPCGLGRRINIQSLS